MSRKFAVHGIEFDAKYVGRKYGLEPEQFYSVNVMTQAQDIQILPKGVAHLYPLNTDEEYEKYKPMVQRILNSATDP